MPDIQPTGTQSIDRAAQLLVSVLETSEPPTVGELASRSGLPKSTTSRLVGALERHGLVQRAPGSGSLVPGRVLLRYARQETGEAELIAVAAAALDRLAAKSGETVNIGIPSAGAVEQLDQRDSRHYLGSTNWVGRRVPPHGSALGKVFLAFGAMALAPGRLEPLGPDTILDGTALARDLESVRARGYAVAVDELEPGLWAVAAPVRDGDGSVIAALSISGPTLRLRDGLVDELGELTKREAEIVSDRLAYDERKRGAA
jgi:IclR family transcriptional regulator, acetate operon repressor